MSKYIPKPIKKIEQREFTNVKFIPEQNWEWSIPSYFTSAERSKIRTVPFDHAARFLSIELNKSEEEFTKPLRAPSMVGVGNFVKPESVKQAEMILASIAKKDRIIPNDVQVDSVVNRFNLLLGNNEWSDAVALEQLDIICKPIGDAPPISSVYDRIEREALNDVINFFYSDGLNQKEIPKESEPSPKDSGSEEKTSNETIIKEEENISE